MARRTGLGLAAGLACALALVLQARFVRQQWEARRGPGDDPAAAWLAWMERLPPLPPGASVGFVTTIDPGQQEARLFLTRYALAPRRVVQGAEARLVLGHFRSAEEADQASRASGLTILAAPGGGLFLMWRPAP